MNTEACVLKLIGNCKHSICTRPCSMGRDHEDLKIYIGDDNPDVGVRYDQKNYRTEYFDDQGFKIVNNASSVCYTRFTTRGIPNDYVTFRGLGKWEYRLTKKTKGKIFFKL